MELESGSGLSPANMFEGSLTRLPSWLCCGAFEII